MASIEAHVTFDSAGTGEVIALSTGHRIKCGGADGDGYCYVHHSFACLPDLSADEHQAIQRAGARLDTEPR